MHRLFVALRPPPLVRAALLATGGGIEGARWQNDEQLHLTLRFLGEVERARAEDVALALSSIATAAPTARIDGVGRFDRRGRTDSLWARLAPAAPLADLARKVNQAVARVGLGPETRAYLPHVTVARFGRAVHEAGVAAWLARHAGLTSEPFAFTHVVLYESHLTHAGAAYEAVARWPLIG